MTVVQMPSLSSPLRLLALIAILSLAIHGCSEESVEDEPPVPAAEITNLSTLLVSAEDIEAAGASTPYGTLLSWWRAMQFGDRPGALRLFSSRLNLDTERLTDYIKVFLTFSEPLLVDIRQTDGDHAQAYILVRAIPGAYGSVTSPTEGEIVVQDSPVSIRLIREEEDWRIADVAYVADLLATVEAAARAAEMAEGNRPRASRGLGD